MEVRAGLSQKQMKRNSGYLKEYGEGFMVLHVKVVSGELNTVMKYTACVKI
jgi:hypothetical protein